MKDREKQYTVDLVETFFSNLDLYSVVCPSEVFCFREGPEMQGVGGEDNHLWRIRCRKVSDVFSVVCFNSSARQTCANSVVS